MNWQIGWGSRSFWWETIANQQQDVSDCSWPNDNASVLKAIEGWNKKITYMENIYLKLYPT